MQFYTSVSKQTFRVNFQYLEQKVVPMSTRLSSSEFSFSAHRALADAGLFALLWHIGAFFWTYSP
jgi:hypothetical protein